MPAPAPLQDVPFPRPRQQGGWGQRFRGAPGAREKRGRPFCFCATLLRANAIQAYEFIVVVYLTHPISKTALTILESFRNRLSRAEIALRFERRTLSSDPFGRNSRGSPRPVHFKVHCGPLRSNGSMLFGQGARCGAPNRLRQL